jgi:hypothetical protein
VELLRAMGFSLSDENVLELLMIVAQPFHLFLVVLVF